MNSQFLLKIFLPLFLHQILLANSTNLEFDGHFICSLNTSFCYMIEYVEKDPFKDDKLGQVNKTCITRPNIAIGSLYFDQYHSTTVDGDGWFNNFYEFLIRISHTCTDTGKRRTMNYWLPGDTYGTSEENLKISFTLDLSNNGARTITDIVDSDGLQS